MAMINVFGSPVTDETVRLVKPGLTRPITATDRAQVALDYINEDSRLVDALWFLAKMRDGYGDGTRTEGLIYNATGGDLTLVLNHTWEGYVWRHPYPRLIRNGQWAGFVHVTDRLTAHSKEAVVYRGTNGDGLSRDWMLAWNTLPNNQNHVYTEIREISNAGGFEWANWYTIDAAMEKQISGNPHSSTSLGCFSGLTNIIEPNYPPVLMGLTSLDGLGIETMAIASHAMTILKERVNK